MRWLLLALAACGSDAASDAETHEIVPCSEAHVDLEGKLACEAACADMAWSHEAYECRPRDWPRVGQCGEFGVTWRGRMGCCSEASLGGASETNPVRFWACDE